MKKILVFPLGDNPYQKLLYKEIRNKNYTIAYYFYHLFGKKNIPWIHPLIVWRLKGYSIFHLHWITPFRSPIENNILRYMFFLYFILFIISIKILGYKLVWTVHNLLPHEKIFPNEWNALRFLSKMSNVKIVHSQHTIKQMGRNNMSIDNTYIIPHGNYINIYLNNFSKEKSRKILAIDQKEFVYLFFGQIKKYKGIDILIKEFSNLTKKYKNITLIIAGECFDKDVQELLKKKIKKIIPVIKHIPQKDVQIYFNAADIVVFPFRRITTSGSLLLALSFKKPVLYTYNDAFKELPDDIGYTFDITKSNDLYLKMETSIKCDKLGEFSKNAYNYASTLNWSAIADKTIELYKK